MFEFIRKQWQDHKEQQEKNYADELNNSAKRYAYYDDINGAPYLAVSGVPLFAITDKKTDVNLSTVSVNDVTTMLLNMRQAYIDKEYSK